MILVGRPWPYSTAQPHAALLGAVDASRPNCRVSVIGAYPPARRGLSVRHCAAYVLKLRPHRLSSSPRRGPLPTPSRSCPCPRRHPASPLSRCHRSAPCGGRVFCCGSYGLARYKSITNAATSSAFEDVVPTTLPFSVIVSQSFFHDQLVRRWPRGRR